MKVSRLAGSLAALMFALVGVASARQPDAPPPAPAEVHPALFVARDADSTLYLFGTVHVRRPGSAWGGANAQTALAESEEIWTELEMSAGADAQAQALVAELGIAPADQPLSSLLTAEENARLAAMAQRLGAPVSSLERMRPWLAAITLTVWPMLQVGYDPNAGVDRAIDAFGDANGKRMRAFETMREQIGFLANLSPEVQHQMLIETIAETEKGPDQLGAMSTAWEEGDLEALERHVITDTREQFPEVYQVLFVQRNTAWMDVLMRELDGAGVDFVAVGAGHLLGPDGLVAQLRARGVAVERVAN